MKIVKYKYSKLAVVFAAFTLTFQSCNDENFGEDYNRNENGIYSADYKSLMAGSISQLALRGGNNFLMKPVLYAQHLSQATYTSESQYNQEGGQWDWYYARCLNNLDKIIKDYSGTVTPTMELQGSKENMIGMSKIFRAIVYKRLTDTYGDVPYTEANLMQEGIKTPKFDSQEFIYKSIIADLKAGRDMLNSSTTLPKGDILYGYTNSTSTTQAAAATVIGRWKKLANSVLLQATLQLSKKYPGASDYAATEFKAALSNSAGVIETVADEAWFTYNSDASVTNPLNAFRAADYRISAQLLESLNGSTSQFNVTSNHTVDARKNAYATSPNGTGLPYGYSLGDLLAAGYSNGTNTLASRYRGLTSARSLMTASYTFLNRAEGAALGWSTEDASALLEKGIVLNYQSIDAKYATAISSNAAAYAAARKADVATFGVKRVIGEEKWVSLFLNGFEAWSEWRRTGYPALKPAPSSLNGGFIPRRIQYPVNEQIFNSINYAAAVQKLVPATDLNTSKIWWDQ